MVGVQIRRRNSRRQMVVPADDYDSYPRKQSFDGDGPSVEPIISVPPSSAPPPPPPSGLSRRPTPGYREGNDWTNQYYMGSTNHNGNTYYNGQTITTTPHLSRPSDAGKSKQLRSCLKKQLSHKLQKKQSPSSSASNHHHPSKSSSSPRHNHHKTSDIAFVGQRVGGHRDLGASYGSLGEQDEYDDDVVGEDEECSYFDDGDGMLGAGPEEEWSNGSSRDTATTKTSSSFSDSGNRSHGGDEDDGALYDDHYHHSYDDVAPLRSTTASESSQQQQQRPSRLLEQENETLRQEVEDLRRRMTAWKQEQEEAASGAKRRPGMMKDTHNKETSTSTMSSSTSSLTMPSTLSLANSNEPLLEEDDEGVAAVPTTLSSVQSTSMSTTTSNSSSKQEDLEASSSTLQSATDPVSTATSTTAKSMKDAMKGLLQVTQRQERTIASLNHKVEKLRAENAALKKQQCREIVTLTNELNRLRRESIGDVRSRTESGVLDGASIADASVTSMDDNSKVDESLERLKVHMQETISLTEQRRQKLRNRIRERERERRASVDTPQLRKDSNLDNLLSSSTSSGHRNRAGSTSSAFTSLLLQEADNLRRSSVQKDEDIKDYRREGEGGKASRRKSRRASSKESSSDPRTLLASSAVVDTRSATDQKNSENDNPVGEASLSFEDFSDDDEDYFNKNARAAPSTDKGQVRYQELQQSQKKKSNVLNATPPRRRCRSPIPSARSGGVGGGRLTLKKQTSSRSMKKQPSIRLLRVRQAQQQLPPNALAASANTIEQAFPKNPRIFRGDSFFGGFDQFYNDDNVVDDEEDDDDIEVVEEGEEEGAME